MEAIGWLIYYYSSFALLCFHHASAMLLLWASIVDFHCGLPLWTAVDGCLDSQTAAVRGEAR